jgi:hypothetical protein
MLESLRADAAYAEQHLNANDSDDISAGNTTLTATIPDIAKYLEEQFLGVPDPKSARAALKSYTSR